jgi:hypothetical protein
MLLLNLANNLDLRRNSVLSRGKSDDLVSELGGFPVELLDL